MNEDIKHWHTVQVRVPFRDVDSWGLVWHGHYFNYVDEARISLLSAFAIPFTEFARLGFLMPIVSVQLDLRAPSKANDVIDVSVAMTKRGAMVDTLFRITSGDKLLARGSTRQVFTKIEGGLFFKIPEAVATSFERLSQFAKDGTP